MTSSDTPVTIYADQDLTTPYPSTEGPGTAVADSSGTFDPIYLDPELVYKVKLTGPDDGITEPVEYWTDDPYQLPWPVAQRTFITPAFVWLNTGAEIEEIIGMFVATAPTRFPGNFDGSGDDWVLAQGAWIVPPDVDTVFWCYLNNVTRKGYMFVGADGGDAFDLDTGEFITWRSAEGNATIATGVWAVPAEVML